MRKDQRHLITFGVAVILTLTTSQLTSRAAVNEYGGQLLEPGQMALSMQTELKLEPNLNYYVSPQFQWGLTSKLELLVALGADFSADGVEAEQGQIIPRFSVLPNLAAGLGVSFPMMPDGGPVGVFPVVFYTWEFSETVSWTTDVGANVPPTDPDASELVIATALEYAPSDARSYFLELDVGAPLTGSWDDVEMQLFWGGYGMVGDWMALGLFMAIPIRPEANFQEILFGVNYDFDWEI